MTPVLEAEDVAVGWGSHPVVQGVALRVHLGERVAIVGENGSGKTTLLRALGGLEPPLSGTIRWCGRELPDPLGLRRGSS